MTNNENINKVVYGNTTLIDLTQDSVTPQTLLEGETAHDKSGALIVGIAKLQPSIPNGKTVTPINDVTIWQKCAGISNPTYTTLAEVLADTGILQTLIASDNAVDYMVRSKDFIGNEALVPKMTSDTTPSGECIGTQESASFPLWHAFDGSTNNNYPWSVYSSNVPYPHYIGYQFQTPKKVNKIKVFQRYENDATGTQTEVDLEASLDGVTFSKIETINLPSDLQHWGTITLSNDTAYLAYRLKFTTSNVYASRGYYSQMQEMQFIYDGICQNSNAMTYIGQNNYASNTLLADSDWREAICNSTYFESVLNVKVPTMTSDTTPSGTVFYNPSGVTFWQVFDGNDSTDGAFPNSVGNYGGYDYGKSVRFMCARIKYTSGSSTDKFKVKGSNDGNTWDELTNEFSNEQLVVANTVIGTYQKIALVETTKVSGSTNLFFYTIQFYGREDV